MTDRRRALTFAAVVSTAAAVAVAYVAWAAVRSESAERPPAPVAAVRDATAQKPFVVYQHVGRDEHYAEIAVGPVDAPATRRTFTGLVCERVHFAGGRGLCLVPRRKALGAAVNARIFGRDFRPLASVRLDGIKSRARVSARGRYGATTTFVTGHSYLDDGFSTHTALIDMRRRSLITDLETFEVTRNGKRFKSIDFNFWGVTFTRDDRGFYATLGTGGNIYLIKGDVETRRASVVADGVECPALSPDETRIAFKRRIRNGWRLHVLDLRTGRQTPLAERRSVDDQVEWLDNHRILYGHISDIWVVRADGRGKPELYVRDALSPAVVRS